ncbi:MAG: response regulator [Desulfobaccales bacterium]
MSYILLFVDDEPEGTEGLRMVLEAKGFNCVTKIDATSAMNYIRCNKVDVIITDIMMEGGGLFDMVESSETGYYFIDKLRREFPKVPVICLSVIGDQRKINILKGKGVLYLRKGETNLKKAVMLIESKATGVTRFGR